MKLTPANADVSILAGSLTRSLGSSRTSQLLQSLKETASRETLAKTAAEAVEVAGLAEGHLVLVVCSDLAELFDKRLRSSSVSKDALHL